MIPSGSGEIGPAGRGNSSPYPRDVWQLCLSLRMTNDAPPLRKGSPAQFGRERDIRGDTMLDRIKIDAEALSDDDEQYTGSAGNGDVPRRCTVGYGDG